MTEALANVTALLHATLNMTVNGTSDMSNATNASSLLSAVLNLTGTTMPATQALDFARAFVNASMVNGSLIVHSQDYSPYCDPCLCHGLSC